MSGISSDSDGDRTDVNESDYVSGTQAVTTTAAEAKVGASALVCRQWIYIENRGPRSVYYGPPGLTGTAGGRLRTREFVFLNHGPDNPVHVRTNAGSATIVVQESG